MFLIEYSKGQFINGETLQWISIEEGVKFTVTGDTESLYTVKPEYERVFLSHLQAINDNSNIEACYYKIRKEKDGK